MYGWTLTSALRDEGITRALGERGLCVLTAHAAGLTVPWAFTSARPLANQKQVSDLRNEWLGKQQIRIGQMGSALGHFSFSCLLVCLKFNYDFTYLFSILTGNTACWTFFLFPFVRNCVQIKYLKMRKALDSFQILCLMV